MATEGGHSAAQAWRLKQGCLTCWLQLSGT